MDRDKVKEEELKGMFDRLDHEVDILYQALYDRDESVDTEYAQKVIRSQLEDIGEVIESMSKNVGEGDAISVTTPSQIEGDKDGN